MNIIFSHVNTKLRWCRAKLKYSHKNNIDMANPVNQTSLLERMKLCKL